MVREDDIIYRRDKIELDINGEKRSVIVRPADTLLRVLRENWD